MQKFMRGVIASVLLVAGAAGAEVVDIDARQLEQLAAQGVPVIDIRTEPEWRATGVLAGSRALTFFDAQGRADPASWLRRAQAFAPPEKPVILICRSGNRSRAAARVLSREGGYGRVYNVSRGVQGWAGRRSHVRRPDVRLPCRRALLGRALPGRLSQLQPRRRAAAVSLARRRSGGR